jgi:hypothetical protein
MGVVSDRAEFGSGFFFFLKGGGVQVVPVALVRTLAEKNLDIGSRHTTQTAWSSMRVKRSERKNKIKNAIA